jgi:methionyl-tRNA formyltransferase
VPTVVVASVNDVAARDFVRSQAPDLVAVCGTSVLKPETFTLAPKGAINIHTGITPEYRSADPIFWALYRGEPEKVGVTIHFVDRGIDTGAIIYQEAVPVYADDSLSSISARCVRRGAELYSQALSDIANGVVRTIDRSGAPNRAHLSVHLGLIEFLRFQRRFRRLAPRLPKRQAVAPAAPQVAR